MQEGCCLKEWQREGICSLQVELQEARHTHTQEGTVSLVVKDNKER